MTADELGGGVDHNVCAMLNGTNPIGRAKGIVNHQRQSMPVGDIRDGVNVRNVAVWIAQRFQIDRLGIALNGPFHFRQIVRIHKRRRYAIVGQCVRQ